MRNVIIVLLICLTAGYIFYTYNFQQEVRIRNEQIVLQSELDSQEWALAMRQKTELLAKQKAAEEAEAAKIAALAAAKEAEKKAQEAAALAAAQVEETQAAAEAEVANIEAKVDAEMANIESDVDAELAEIESGIDESLQQAEKKALQPAFKKQLNNFKLFYKNPVRFTLRGFSP